MNPAPAALLALTLSVLSCSALAQGTTIYRCGPEGRELSQTPCPGGQVLPMTPPPEPSAQQRREAAKVAEREAALAKQMERERLQREAADKAQASGAAGIHGRGQAPGPAPAASAAAPGKGKHQGPKKAQGPYKPEGFTSTGPKPVKPPKQADTKKPGPATASGN